MKCKWNYQIWLNDDALDKIAYSKYWNNEQEEKDWNIIAVISALGISPRNVQLYSERTGDGNLIRIGKWIKRRLLLFDMGYFSYSLFERVDRRGRIHSMEAQKLSKIIPRLKRSMLDTQIEVKVTRSIMDP